MTFWVALGALLLVSALILRKEVRNVTVFEYERGLEYRQGRFRGVVAAGSYWVLNGRSTILKVDMRPVIVPVAGQEILTADGVAVKVSLSVRYQVNDPARAIHEIEDYRSAIYTEVQLALRAIISATAIDTVLETRGQLGKQARPIAAEKLAGMGVDLLDVDIKDLTLPGELKKIFSQVVKARQEGLAALERARGETSALRNLANAAKMIERNPGLMQLRVLQALGQQSGNTIVLGFSPSGGPIPISAGEASVEVAEPEES